MSATLRAFSLPLSDPFETARERIERREGFLLSYDRDGVGGVGEGTPLVPWTESFRECELALRRIREALGDGAEAAARDAAEGRPAASHALECALLDRSARRADRPLYRFLGAGGRVESVPVNAVLGNREPTELASAARSVKEEGFGCLKVKVGARSPDVDLERLRAVREAVGEAVSLRADANGAWSPETARDLWPELGAIGVDLVEQPVGADALEAHNELRDLTGPAVALDESLRTVGLEAVIEAEAADAVVLKPMALGGPEAAVTAAQRVRRHDVIPIVTTTVDGAVARTAAVHVAATLTDPVPCGLATADRLGRDVAPDPAPVSDGRIHVPQTPGHGVRPWEGRES